MSVSSKGLFLWRTRVVVFAVWATFVLLWRRGGYLSLPNDAAVVTDELAFIALLACLPGAVLLLGAPLARFAAGYFGVLLVGALVAESVASWQERRFVARCEQTAGAGIIESYRFPGKLGGRLLFIRSPDGTEHVHAYD